jgi:hypothetical protein
MIEVRGKPLESTLLNERRQETATYVYRTRDFDVRPRLLRYGCRAV